MAFVDLGFQSYTLGHGEHVSVILPEWEREGGSKVLYLLHGHGDDHTTWARRTSIERYAEKYGIAVVMPNGNRAFYTNTASGHRYYDYVSEELPEKMCKYFHISDKPEDKYIAGLSMGGYGAIKIALRECGKYAAAAGLSSAIDVKSDTIASIVEPTYGGKPIPDEEDCFSLASKAVKRADRPRIFLGEGTSDFLYKDNEHFRQHLDKIGYEYTYRESEGAHSWDFWDEYIQYVLDWMFNE